MRRYDTAIIGGGLAGMMAALTAKTANNKVILLSKGYGTAYYGPGTIDCLGKVAGFSAKIPVRPLPEVNRLYDLHPYKKTDLETLKKAFNKLCEQLKLAGYHLESNGENNFLLPTAIGSIRPAYLAPTSLSKGDILAGEDLLLVGIEGFKYFYPALVAQNLAHTISKLGMQQNIKWCSIEVEANWSRTVSPYDLALWFEQTGNMNKFIDKLKSKLGNSTRVGLPAVLGIAEHAQLLEKLEQQLERKVFEIPTIPPCIPGIRLYNALSKRLRESGIEMITGYPVRCGSTQSGLINHVEVESPGRNTIYHADNFVLATGGLAGGGLVSGPGWVREDIFNLPVYYEKTHEKWTRENLFAPQGQPYSRFGLEVDWKMRPLDHQGRVCFSNLRAAGAILAHFDALAEKCGSGVDVVTGYLAGVECRGEAGNYECNRDFSGGSLLKVQHL